MTTLVASFTPGGNRNNFSGYVGFQFSPTGSNITVSTLGVRVATSNAANQNVYLLSSNVVIASAVVNITGVVPVGTFAYASISPVTLTVGTTYQLVVQETSGGQLWADAGAITLNGAGSAIACFSVSLGGFSTSAVNQMYGGVDLNGVAPTPVDQLPKNTPDTSRLLIANNNAWQDENIDDDQTARTLSQWRKAQRVDWVTAANLSVSKVIQYDVLVPPDNAISVSKDLVFTVVEAMPSIRLHPFYFWMRNREAWQNDTDAEEQANSQRILTSRRIPTLTRVDSNITLAGVAITGQVGTLSIEVDKTLTGVSATSHIGTLTTETDKSPAIDGVQATGQVGTPTGQGDKVVTGVQATGQVGTFTVEIDTDVALTGVEATGQVGTPTIAFDANINLTGVEATGEIEPVIVQQGFTMAGVGATAIVTQPIVRIEKNLGFPPTLFDPYRGVQADTSIGTFGFTSDLVLPSCLATAQVGHIRVLGSLEGVQADTHVGRLGMQSGNFPFTGVQAVARLGSVLPFIGPDGTFVNLPGVAATARTGTLRFGRTVNLMGVQANAQVGVLQTLIIQVALVITSLQCETIPPASTDAMVSLRWSDNKGQSYSNPVMQSLGGTGQYNKNLQWRRLGMARDRIFEISWSSDQETALTGAYISIQDAKT